MTTCTSSLPEQNPSSVSFADLKAAALREIAEEEAYAAEEERTLREFAEMTAKWLGPR